MRLVPYRRLGGGAFEPDGVGANAASSVSARLAVSAVAVPSRTAAGQCHRGGVRVYAYLRIEGEVFKLPPLSLRSAASVAGLSHTSAPLSDPGRFELTSR
jgi:hypothetical protein